MRKFTRHLANYYDLESLHRRELEKEDLVPDHSEFAENKYKELIKRGNPFTSNEIWFLGAMNVVDFYNHYPAEAEDYMDM